MVRYHRAEQDNIITTQYIGTFKVSIGESCIVSQYIAIPMV